MFLHEEELDHHLAEFVLQWTADMDINCRVMDVTLACRILKFVGVFCVGSVQHDGCY